MSISTKRRISNPTSYYNKKTQHLNYSQFQRVKKRKNQIYFIDTCTGIEFIFPGKTEKNLFIFYFCFPSNLIQRRKTLSPFENQQLYLRPTIYSKKKKKSNIFKDLIIEEKIKFIFYNRREITGHGELYGH